MHAVRLKSITKQFGTVLANDAVDIDIEEGTIHAIIGENGAGKTTIMEILYGFYQANSGEIELYGEKVHHSNPMMNSIMRIGMVHQHFMLIPPMTVAENIILGIEPTDMGGVLKLSEAEQKIKKLSDEYGLEIDPQARVETLSVGLEQRVEILKALYREVNILILDEPTAVLTPLEVKDFFEILKKLKEQGKTIILITHKLEEVLEISDQVTVMRNGKKVGDLPTSEATAEILANMMVGREVLLRVIKPKIEPGEVILKVENLSIVSGGKTKVKNISFEVREGEVLGVAGVEGNGQTELIEALTGLRKANSGRISYMGKDVTNRSARDLRETKTAHVPANRKAHGYVADYFNSDNLILGFHHMRPFCRNNGFLNRKIIDKNADALMEKFDIRPPIIDITTSSLSGGNQQKLIVAREFNREPKLLIIAQPTRGVDIGAIEFIHNQILGLQAKKTAILLVSAELEEIRSLSDRTIVMWEGEIAGEVTAETFDIQEVGLLMTGQTHA